jgi:hypothetical protein
MKSDTRRRPARPNARSPMSGYVRMAGSGAMQRWRSRPVYQQMAATPASSARLSHPPSASAYGTDSSPTPDHEFKQYTSISP